MSKRITSLQYPYISTDAGLRRGNANPRVEIVTGPGKVHRLDDPTLAPALRRWGQEFRRDAIARERLLSA